MTDAPITQPTGVGAPGPPPVPPPAPPPIPPVQAPAPAPAPQPAGDRRRGSGAWIVLAAVLALLVGVGIGYAIGLPGKNDATKQRDAAQEQVTQLQGDLTQAQSDAAAATAASKGATNARDKCSTAATDAKDLIEQDLNLWGDLNRLMAMTPGSAEEVQLEQHMTEQASTMDAQKTIVDAELAACTSALNG